MLMFWLFISILLGALRLLFYKIASVEENSNEALKDFYVAIVANYNTWQGLFCYGLSFLIWIRVHTRFDLTYARPFISIGVALL
jgi:hypothetical protein